MKIEQSMVKLYAKVENHQKIETKIETELWHQNLQSGVVLNISEQGRSIQQECIQKCAKSDKIESKTEMDPKDKLKILLIEKLLSKITGKKIKFKLLRKTKVDENTAKDTDIKIAISSQMPANSFGFVLRLESYKQLQQDFSFSAKAKVKTQNGEEFELDIKLNFSQSFVERFNLEIRFGQQKNIDPLVINLDSNLPSFSERYFEFDLDADSVPDKIRLLSGNSGFLALDKNQNNKIDSGLELFGPSTGDGFFELSGYDTDKNGWIDENDPVFPNLLVWIKTDSDDKVVKLSELGIGAIFVGNAESNYSLYDFNTNTPYANVKKTGLFLFENKKAGVIQHIDLII